MAWAERLPSGRYRGVYRDAAGKRRSSGTFTHKPRAERAAATSEAKARKSSWADPDAGRRTWGEWCDEWWPTRSVEGSTLKVDASRRRTHLDPHWAKVPVGAIRRHDVKSWAASMARRGVGPSTVQRAVHLLSASLAAAVDAEVIDVNPAVRMMLPKGPQAGERFLTAEEYDAVQAQLPTTDDQLVVHMLAFTGLRWGELAGLHVNRLDLERELVKVVEVYDGKNHVIKPYPKGKQVRDVPIPGWLVEMLRDHEPATCKVRHSAGRCSGRLVFSTEGGAVLEGSKWSRIWRESVELAGLDHVRPHDLRHTYCSWLIQRGVPLAEVGRLAGHVSTVTTQKYAHLADIPHDAVMAALPAPTPGGVRGAAPILPHESLAEEAS